MKINVLRKLGSRESSQSITWGGRLVLDFYAVPGADSGTTNVAIFQLSQ